MLFLLASLLSVPATWIDRPLNNPSGDVEVGFDLRAYRSSFGPWLGADLHGDAAISDRLELGGRLLAIAREPSSPCACDRFGGVLVEAQYLATPSLALRGEVGMVRSNGTPFVRYAPPEYEGHLKPSIGIGAAYRAKLGARVALTVEPWLDAQPGADASQQDYGPFFTLRVPVAVNVQATSRVVARVESGAWGVAQLGNGGGAGVAVPVVAGAQVTVAGSHLDLGASVGVANVLGGDPAATLFGVASATWRTGP